MNSANKPIKKTNSVDKASKTGVAVSSISVGLATRLMAFNLFVFNIIAVVSYPVIWQGGYYDHKLWGVMLLVVVIYGQGRVSLDHIICKKCH
jgi:uncharacterized membrane protein YphA (DoxX/SURF4 family)